MDARMKTMEAMTSCSPPARPWVAWFAGKAGDRIQISSGTVAMRLIVMELGRFMYCFDVEPTWWACGTDTSILP